MAYFNHAFKKTFILTDYLANASITTTSALTAGQIGLFQTKDWSKPTLPSSGATTNCCVISVVQGSPYASDKVGSFHGGYQESLKSKGINPKYVNKYWEAEAQDAKASIIHIGKTPYTQQGISPAPTDCCPTFLCGETYHLRVDVKGSAPLRALNHNAYEELSAYTGCCPDGTITPTAVNPVTVYIEWSKQIQDSEILQGGKDNAAPFIFPVVYVTEAGDGGAYANGMTVIWPKGTSGAVQGAGEAAIKSNLTWSPALTAVYHNTTDAYTPVAYSDQCAGMSLVGAYVETTFGDCTFQPTDFYSVAPVEIYASEVDLNGDPCEFAGVCVHHECTGTQAQGFGETVARDYIMSESYRQNHFSNDLRIREITQGNDLLGTGAGQVDRTAKYDRTYILHSVPRFNNPSGTFDNDQYLIEVCSLATVAGRAERDDFRADFEKYIKECGNNECIISQDAEQDNACAAPSIVVVA